MSSACVYLKARIGLEYEVYIPIAEKEIAKICQDIPKKWNVVKILMVHGIG